MSYFDPSGIDRYIEDRDDEYRRDWYDGCRAKMDDSVYCDVCGSAEDPERAAYCVECDAALCVDHQVASLENDTLCPECARVDIAFVNAILQTERNLAVHDYALIIAAEGC